MCICIVIFVVVVVAVAAAVVEGHLDTMPGINGLMVTVKEDSMLYHGNVRDTEFLVSIFTWSF